MAAPSLPPRSRPVPNGFPGKYAGNPGNQPGNLGYPGSQGNPVNQDYVDDDDHYNMDGFDDNEFSDEDPGQDYEEPQDPGPRVQPQGSFRDRAVPPLPPGRGSPAQPPGRGPQPGLPPRAVPNPIVPYLHHDSDDDNDGEEYTSIPDEMPPTRLFTGATSRSSAAPPGRAPVAVPGHARPLPPPPQESFQQESYPQDPYPQEDYEVPNENHQEEQYTEPEELIPSPRRPTPTYPIPSFLQGAQGRGLAQQTQGRSLPQLPPQPQQQDDIYEGEDPQQSESVYEEDQGGFGGGGGEVYEEMENTAPPRGGVRGGPPPLPGGKRPPMPSTGGPQLPPPRDQPNQPSKTTQGKKFLDMDTVAIHNQMGKLRKAVPSFNPPPPDTNNNQEDEVDPADLPLSERMARLAAKGGMFAGGGLKSASAPRPGQGAATGARPSPTPYVTPTPPPAITPSWKKNLPAAPAMSSSPGKTTHAPWAAPGSPPVPAAPSPVSGARPLPDTPRGSTASQMSNTSQGSNNSYLSSNSGISGGSASNSPRESNSSNDSGTGTFSPPRSEGSQGAVRPLPKVPPDQELEGLYSYAWYFASLGRTQAQSKIRETKTEGAFLIRKSERGGADNPYTLSVLYSSKVWMLHIRKRHDQKFALGTQKPSEACFSTIPELVEYHKKNMIVLAQGDQVAGEVTLVMSPPNSSNR